MLTGSGFEQLSGGVKFAVGNATTTKTGQYHKISVSGLDFEPEIVVITQGDVAYATVSNNYFNFFSTTGVFPDSTSTQGTGEKEYQFRPDGFTVITRGDSLGALPGAEVSWAAFGGMD